MRKICSSFFWKKTAFLLGISFHFKPYFLELHLTTISTELGFLGKFVRLSLKPCSLYHEKLFIQVVNDISSQVFNNFFSASDFMEAVRGCLCFYRYEKMQGCVIKVRLLRSMHAQDQQKQALQSQFRKKLPKAVDF